MHASRSPSILLGFSIIAAITAACGSGSANHAPPLPKPSGPAPSVSKHDDPDGDFRIHFEASGLPAVTADAGNVVLAVMDELGPMSPPNLRLSVRDRGDNQVHEVVVLTADQGQAFAGGAETPATFDDARLAEANRYLGDTHAQRGWFPMAEMALEDPTASDAGGEADDDGMPHMPKAAHSGAVALTWDEGAVTVSVGGKVVVDRHTQGWVAGTTPPPANCDECPVCSNPSYLGKAWIDAERKVIVARISYIGNDSCWEPPSQDHVISW